MPRVFISSLLSDFMLKIVEWIPDIPVASAVITSPLFSRLSVFTSQLRPMLERLMRRAILFSTSPLFSSSDTLNSNSYVRLLIFKSKEYVPGFKSFWLGCKKFPVFTWWVASWLTLISTGSQSDDESPINSAETASGLLEDADFLNVISPLLSSDKSFAI